MLLVRIGGSELATDSVSLFCNPKEKKQYSGIFICDGIFKGSSFMTFMEQHQNLNTTRITGSGKNIYKDWGIRLNY